MSSNRKGRGPPKKSTQSRRSLVSKRQTLASEPKVTIKLPIDDAYEPTVQQINAMGEIVQSIRHDMNLLDFRKMIPPAVRPIHLVHAVVEQMHSEGAITFKYMKSTRHAIAILAIVANALYARAVSVCQFWPTGYATDPNIRSTWEISRVAAPLKPFADNVVVVTVIVTKAATSVRGVRSFVTRHITAVVTLDTPIGVMLKMLCTSMQEMVVNNNYHQASPITRVRQDSSPFLKLIGHGSALVAEFLANPSRWEKGGLSTLDWASFDLPEVPCDTLDWADRVIRPTFPTINYNLMVWDPMKDIANADAQVDLMFGSVMRANESREIKLQKITEALEDCSATITRKEKVIGIMKQAELMTELEFEANKERLTTEVGLELRMLFLKEPNKWHQQWVKPMIERAGLVLGPNPIE